MDSVPLGHDCFSQLFDETVDIDMDTGKHPRCVNDPCDMNCLIQEPLRHTAPSVQDLGCNRDIWNNWRNALPTNDGVLHGLADAVPVYEDFGK